MGRISGVSRAGWAHYGGYGRYGGYLSYSSKADTEQVVAGVRLILGGFPPGAAAR
jgi:hypothetical protein